MRSIKFITLGCKANQYDTQSIRERFLAKGFQEAKPGIRPDYFLINTCTVTAGADQKSRHFIRKSLRANPKATVIVTGCLVEKDSLSLAKIKGTALIIKKSFFPDEVSHFSQHTRAFLKVQDGCRNFCTYCKVALVRGKERSKKLKQAVNEAKKLAACGYQEIVLTGICLGSYGKDLLPQIDLVDLIKELEKIDGLRRIRISSIEAGDVSNRLIKHLKQSQKLCRHLHIPIQSGDDKILKRMNRKYTRRKYLSLISRLRKALPDLTLTTDCLVGFPGETEKNFKHTFDLLKKIQPLKVHIFPYSCRPGTKAATFNGLVDAPTVKRRCVQLQAYASNLRDEFMQQFVGKKLDVLVESRTKDMPGYLEGLTGNYLPVRLPFLPGLENKILNAKLVRQQGDFFYGEDIDASTVLSVNPEQISNLKYMRRRG